MIGSFGDIVFEVSADKVLTFSDFERKGAVRLAEHEIIDAKPVPQIAGQTLDEIGFSMSFNVSLGVDPADGVRKLREAMTEGREQALVIGPEILGKWLISGIDDSWQYIGSDGRPSVIRVSIKLKEYPE